MTDLMDPFRETRETVDLPPLAVDRTVSALVDNFRPPSAEFREDLAGSYLIETDEDAGEAPNGPEYCPYCRADLLRDVGKNLPTSSWVCEITGEDTEVRPAFTGYRDGLARSVECSCTPCLLNSRPKRKGRPRKICEKKKCRRDYERDRKRRQRHPRTGAQGSGRLLNGDGRHYVTGRNGA